MIDRASTFSEPGIVQLLKTQFVPVAVDAWYFNRQKDAEGEFYRKVVTQDESRRDMNSSTQGKYACTADGRLLGFTNHGVERVPRVRQLLDRALRDFQPVEAKALDGTKRHAPYDRTLPAGTVVVDVTGKVLGGYEATGSESARISQSSLGEDRLWLKGEETEALASGRLPESLKRRMARFHLNDFTRGEPMMWSDAEIRKFDLVLSEGRLSGRVHLETVDGRRGWQAELLGFVQGKEGKLTRFDVVATGLFWGEGPLTHGAPKGKFPHAVAFRLADPAAESSKVPPEGARNLDDYFR